jgi:hypothetical protein
MTARLQPQARTLCVLALVVLATALASDKLGSPTTGIDDANIFFVYARNFSAGDGFVFNPGGERVEGFTSLLWVFVCSAAIAIAHDRNAALVRTSLVWVTILCCLRSTILGNPGADRPSYAWASTFTLLLRRFRHAVGDRADGIAWARSHGRHILTIEDDIRGFRHGVSPQH